jgi:hypothetical protein
VTPLEEGGRRCFHRLMARFWDEQRVDRLEKKVDRLETKIDNGFEIVRAEGRADYRTLLGIILAMFVTMIFGFAGILGAILLQLN